MKNMQISKSITNTDSGLTDKYFNEINQLPLLTIEEEVELSKKIQEGDDIALRKFVEGNLRFVVSVAKQYQYFGEPLDDLICSGNEGVIKAAKRFDHTKGFKFISYGIFWIRQSILKHLAENGKTIKLPGHKLSILSQMKKLSQEFEQSLQRTPTTEELKDLYIVEVAKKGKTSTIKEIDIDLLLVANNKISSLDKPFGDDGDYSLKDSIKSEDNNDYISEVDTKDFQETLKNIFNKNLTNNENMVVSMNFGLFGNVAHSLEEIAEKLELKRERIRQIREKAIRKLRQKSIAKYLKF